MVTSDGGGGTDPAEYEGKTEDKHSRREKKLGSQFSPPSFPPPHDTTVDCFKTGLPLIHKITNRPLLLCSLTKKCFLLKYTKSQNKSAEDTKLNNTVIYQMVYKHQTLKNRTGEVKDSDPYHKSL